MLYCKYLPTYALFSPGQILRRAEDMRAMPWVEYDLISFSISPEIQALRVISHCRDGGVRGVVTTPTYRSPRVKVLGDSYLIARRRKKTPARMRRGLVLAALRAEAANSAGFIGVMTQALAQLSSRSRLSTISECMT